MSTFENKLKYAKVWLTLSSPFYGSLLSRVKVAEKVAPKGEGFNSNPKKTAWTDGRGIYFDSEFVDTLSKEEFAGVIVHEVLHVAFLHVERSRGQKRIPVLYNIAADYVINLIIKNEYENGSNSTKKLKLPDFALYDSKWDGMSTEQVYDELYQQAKKEGRILKCNMGSPGDSEDGEGAGDYRDALPGDLKDYKPDLDWNSKKMTKKEAKQVKDALTKAAHTAKMQGSLPAGIARELDEVLAPKVDWRTMLRDFLQAYPSDWDFTERDRRFMNTPFYLPSFKGEKLKLAVVIDTSGSISQKELNEFLSETFSILQGFSSVELVLISADAEVANVQTVYDREDLFNYKLKGFGGTDFRPAFKYVEDEVENVFGLIYFTDGYGNFPEEQPANLKTMWIMTTEVEPPFGRIVKYETESDW